jgi:hypothetical protein
METMKKRHGLFFPLILLTTALACVLPGQPPASFPPPTPDTRLGTMVAETVAAALELTQQSAPMPILPPESTPEPAATPTPPEDTSGSTLTKRDDGTTLFTDTRAGYEIAVPAGWLAVRVNQIEYFDAWLLPELSDPALQSSFSSIQDKDPDVSRLFAFDIREGHIRSEVVTSVNLIWDQQAQISFDNEDDLQAIAADLPASVEGLTVYATEIVTSSDGTMHGEIQSEIAGLNASGGQVTLYQKMIIFNLKTGTLIITFTTEIEVPEATLSMFDGMIASLSIVKE